MRVLFLQRQPCIRTLKYAVALRAASPDLRLAFAYQGRTLGQYYGSGDDLFDAWWELGDSPHPDEAFRRVLDAYGPDLVHSHNLPDSLTVLAQDAVDGAVPIVHDVHDLQRLRRTPYNDGFPEPDDPLALERLAVERSDAVITVSREVVEAMVAEYALPPHTLVVPNLVLEQDLPALADPARDGRTLVYQGSLQTDGGHYDLRRVFRDIVGAGVELHVHPNRHTVEYRDLGSTLVGMHMHRPTKPADLMRRLTGYAAGWAGFNAELNSAHLDTVLPNKLFEYIGAGLPVVTLRGHRALSRFVEEEGVGFVLDSPAQIAGVMDPRLLATVRERVASVRSRHTFEGMIGPVVDLYRALVARSAETSIRAAPPC